MKRPAFQFYPADWRKDAALQSCSVAAQGLWINVLCIAHECEPYGHLTVNGKAMSAPQIGRLVGLGAKECDRLLDELLQAGVSSVTSEGMVFSRRMVRDEQARELRAEIGKQNGVKGAASGHLGAEHGKKGGRPKAGNPGNEPGEKPPQNPLPSSSSSSSPTGEEISNLSVAPARPSADQPAQLALVPGGKPEKAVLPDCPHLEVLALWAEVLPSMPQHLPSQWKGARADHLRVRWRETAEEKGWTNQAQGLAFLRKLFGWVGRSPFLTGRSASPG